MQPKPKITIYTGKVPCWHNGKYKKLQRYVAYNLDVYFTTDVPTTVVTTGDGLTTTGE